MAHIHGITPGLVPSIDKNYVAEAQAEKNCTDPRCVFCAGLLIDKALKGAVDVEDDDEDGAYCFHCRQFFGLQMDMLGFGGVTNYSPADTLKKLQKARDGHEWGMLLVDRTFTAPGGVSFSVEKGDCFKIGRIGALDWPSELASSNRTHKAATVDVMVGPIALTLYPHEFAPMTQGWLLTSVADQEMEVKFICQEDEIGYYTPTPEVREQIKLLYG